jgi:hypothetical protein
MNMIGVNSTHVSVLNAVQSLFSDPTHQSTDIIMPDYSHYLILRVSPIPWIPYAPGVPQSVQSFRGFGGAGFRSPYSPFEIALELFQTFLNPSSQFFEMTVISLFHVFQPT